MAIGSSQLKWRFVDAFLPCPKCVHEDAICYHGSALDPVNITTEISGELHVSQSMPSDFRHIEGGSHIQDSSREFSSVWLKSAPNKPCLEPVFRAGTAVMFGGRF